MVSLTWVFGGLAAWEVPRAFGWPDPNSRLDISSGRGMAAFCIGWSICHYLIKTKGESEKGFTFLMLSIVGGR